MTADDPFLAETVGALRNLGLNVVKAKIAQQKNKNVFYGETRNYFNTSIEQIKCTGRI